MSNSDQVSMAGTPVARPPAEGVPGLADEYRTFMSSFPTGVAVITALDASGQPHGLTCTSIASVTLCPPTLLVCLDVHSGTLKAIDDSGVFGVNLLSVAAEPTAVLFASPVPDRFSQVTWQNASLGSPWLFRDSFALAECKVSATVWVSDHCVVFGEVAELANALDAPLLYSRRQFRSLRS
jgi:flavin reductase (DIM6/NTAB) family NADH-FMN oxidoreductase RutF